jgi:pyruvate/2-oxoglutarate dehydrogenase complex dihydrolipoamide dehydrogenase (E3) component
VVRNALFFGSERFSSIIMPWTTYTDPEVAHVGLYEHDAAAVGVECEAYKASFDDVDRSMLDGETDGFVKIVVKKGPDEILGATIVGSHAGDMISEITVAMTAKMGLSRLAGVIHPYPTAAEGIRAAAGEFSKTRLTPTVKRIFRGLMALRR